MTCVAKLSTIVTEPVRRLCDLIKQRKYRELAFIFRRLKSMASPVGAGFGRVLGEVWKATGQRRVKLWGCRQAKGRRGRRQRAGLVGQGSGAEVRNTRPTCRDGTDGHPSRQASRAGRRWSAPVRTVGPGRPSGTARPEAATVWAESGGKGRRRHGLGPAAAAGHGFSSRCRQGRPATGRPAGGGKATREGGASAQEEEQRTQKRRRVAPPPFFLEERKL